MSGARRLLVAAVRVIVPLVLLVVIVRVVDVRAAAGRLARLDVGPLVAALAGMALLYALYATRWRFTAARVGVSLTFRRAYGEYLVSTLLNQLLPLGVAGDVVRALRHHRRLGAQKTLGPAARAVVLERLSGVCGLALLLVPSAAAWLADGHVAGVFVGVGALAAVVVGAAALSWSDARAALIARGAFAVQLGLSVAAALVLVAVFACCARANHAAIDLVTAIRVVPVVLAVATVPFPFGGVGVREAATIALYRALGLDAVTALSVSLTFGLVNLAAALPGLLVLVLPSPSPSPSPEPRR